MKLVLISIIVFAFPISLYDQVPEWQSEVVIKADYGYEEDEYGYEGILESKYEDESPVKALYVDDTNIYIYDKMGFLNRE